MKDQKPGKRHASAVHKTSQITPPVTEAVFDEPIAQSDELSWEANEYQPHQRGAGWYTVLILATAVLVGLSYWLLGLMSALVIIMMSVAVMVYAGRTPRQLKYSLNDTGLTIGQKFYPYSDFTAFAVVPDKEWFTIELDPVKRFMPRIEIFFDREEIDQIISILELRLPRADRDPDIIERLTRYLKF